MLSLQTIVVLLTILTPFLLAASLLDMVLIAAEELEEMRLFVRSLAEHDAHREEPPVVKTPGPSPL